MQINIATGDSTINAIQDGNYVKVTSTSRKDQLTKRINILKNHMENNDCDEETIKDMNEQIAEYKNELK